MAGWSARKQPKFQEPDKVRGLRRKSYGDLTRTESDLKIRPVTGPICLPCQNVFPATSNARPPEQSRPPSKSTDAEQLLQLSSVKPGLERSRNGASALDERSIEEGDTAKDYSE